MANDQITQVNTDTVMLSSFPVSTAETVSLEPTPKQGNLALLGTIQALSSVTEEVAPEETEDSTTEYTAADTEDTGNGTSTSDTVSHKGLIGGSALSMSSLSVIDMQRYLLLISYNAMQQSWLSNEVLNDTAREEYSLSMDAAEESYRSGIAEAHSQLTSCISSAVSAGVTIPAGTYGLYKMSKATNEMSNIRPQQTHFRNFNKEPQCPYNTTEIGETGDLPNQVNYEKVEAIKKEMQRDGAGRIDTPTITNKYGTIDVRNDPIAQYALRKAAYDMHKSDPAELEEAQARLKDFHETAQNNYNSAQSMLQQVASFRELTSAFENGFKSQFTREQAEHNKAAEEDKAEAAIEKSVSEQFSALQSTWRSLNSTLYEQTMSLLPSQMAALVKANSLS